MKIKLITESEAEIPETKISLARELAKELKPQKQTVQIIKNSQIIKTYKYKLLKGGHYV